MRPAWSPGVRCTNCSELAELQSARIVFSGDTKQIQSVEAGDALRVLENESRLKSSALTQVQRQTDPDYREAIQELRRNPESGFEKLDRIGAIREVAWADRAQAVAQAYAESQEPQCPGRLRHPRRNRSRDRGDPRRSANKPATLAKCVQVARDVSLNWTTAQKSDTRNFRAWPTVGVPSRREGHRQERNAGGGPSRSGQASSPAMIVGEERTVTAKQAKSFDVYERRAIEVAAGDQLLLTANRREPGFRATNGEIVTVVSCG